MGKIRPNLSFLTRMVVPPRRILQVESDKSDSGSRHRTNVDRQSTSVGNQSFDQSTVVNHQSSVAVSFGTSNSRDRPIQDRPHQERSELRSNFQSVHPNQQSDKSFHRSNRDDHPLGEVRSSRDVRINTSPSERRTGRTDVRPTIALRYSDLAELSPNTMLRSRQHRECSVSRTCSVKSRSRHHSRSSSSRSSHRRSRKK